jgi:Fe-S cluster assembly ATPase SufC
VTATLEIRDLHAAVAGREILRGIDLTVRSGEVHAVMGPNGAGKSTLSAVVMGKPGYEVRSGGVTLDGHDVLAMSTWERAAAGLHLVMQYPTEVPGVALDDMLREALNARGGDAGDLDARLTAEAARIGFEERLLHRALNVDLSGGEKKRNDATRRCSWRSSGRASRCWTSSTPGSTSTRCGPARGGSRTRPTARTVGRDSGSWRSRTTTACWRSCVPTSCTS